MIVECANEDDEPGITNRLDVEAGGYEDSIREVEMIEDDIPGHVMNEDDIAGHMENYEQALEEEADQRKANVRPWLSCSEPRPDAKEPPSKADLTKPFLLLDTREADDFERCHIYGAINFPISRLSRAANCFINEIYQYQNKNGKVIIVYDEVERVAPQVASIMCERGVENVLLLSGGMRLLYQFCPNGLLHGTVPPGCFETPRHSRNPSRLNTGRLLSRNNMVTGRSSIGAFAAAPAAMGRVVSPDLGIVRQRLEILDNNPVT